MELDRSFGVVMRHGVDLVADSLVDGEFFAQLAEKTRGKRFARVALTARKLPEPLEMDAGLSLRDEEVLVLFDDRGRYDNCRRHTQSRFIGQTRHFGLRAVQTVAPKSINA
jgi:hypothetical protein